MPPPTRSAQPKASHNTTTVVRSDALTDFQTRRLQRRLDDFERTNPTDIPASSFVAASQSKTAQAQANIDQQKKKQSANVRKVLYARKSLKDWLDELPKEPVPPYLSAAASAPTKPARKICSSCGYIGAYRCPRCAEWSCDRICVEVHERDGGCGVGG